ncbi:MAG: class I SAM-dependent methyltransferase [Longimicrobiaceae bacterium]
MSRLERAYFSVTRWLGRASGRYYLEDFHRVYPDNLVYNRLGMRRRPTRNTENNFRNHCKFYRFAGQFVARKRVADVGCGSGYGCKILKEAGAAAVYGSDISRSSIRFARSRYPDAAEFSVQGITELSGYADDSFEVTISSEVLEHIKEYGMEDQALSELKRITRPGGLLVVATPNSELTGEHGFFFEEIDSLFRGHFTDYLIFENALLPFGESEPLWEERRRQGRTGVVVSETIDLSEIELQQGARPKLKEGVPAGKWQWDAVEIDTRLLHNSHSWVVLARK